MTGVTERPYGQIEPTFLGSVWRYRGLVIALALFGLAGAAALANLLDRDVDYVATATMEVVDPARASLLAGASPGQTSDRYIANQILLLRSSSLASRASELAAVSGAQIASGEIIANSTIQFQPGTDIVTISFGAGNPSSAIAGANSIAEAYIATRSETVEAAATAGLERVDTALAEVAKEIQQIDDQIAAYDPNLVMVRDRTQLAAGRLISTTDLLNGGDSEVVASALTDLEVLRSELLALQLVQDIYQNDPALASLVQRQQRLIEWSIQLTTRRLELEIDQNQAIRAVATFAQALDAEKESSSVVRFLALGLVLGAGLGATAAYFMASFRRTFLSPLAPESILEAPILSEVPDFGEERIASVLPVRDAPRSATAEAFRFTATALENQTRLSGATLVAFVSSETADGKSVITTNTAIAAAAGGRRVLLVDADFGHQGAGQILGVKPTAPGLTDIVSGRRSLAEALLPVHIPNWSTISYLGRGTVPAVAPDFFRTAACEQFFLSLHSGFDLVLIDTPPLLQVAYGTSVARLADGVVVVLRHGSRQSQLIDLDNRLGLMGARILGYGYNQAPLRPMMTQSHGSMKDIVGDQGLLLPVDHR